MSNQRGVKMSKYLNIVHNLKPADDNFELFPEIYDDEFIGSTFSLSPNYLSKNLKHFKKITLIIGIKDDNYQTKIINKINYNENISKIINLNAIDFINKLDKDTQDKLLSNRINLKSPLYPIHSKFFILSNKDKSETRVILGSANLTEQALNTKIPQFEDILVFDNNKEIYDLYSNRFNELSKYTFDFISSSMKKQLKQSKKELKDSTSLNIISLDNNESKTSINSDELNKINKPVFINLSNEKKETIINEGIAELHENIEKKIEEDLLPKDTLAKIQSEVPEILNNLTKDKIEIEKTYKVIKKSIIKSQKKDTPFRLEKGGTNIQKIIKETIQVHSIEMEKEDHLKRFNLKRLDNHMSLQNKEGNIVVIKEEKIIPYAQYQDKETITKSLQNIDSIIRGYEKYVSKYNDEIGKKIFEVILYAFTSPFISLIRKRTLINEARQHIPLFMFIGGIAGSGKSSLLRCISKMMKDDESIKAFIDYDRISLHNTPSSKTVETGINIKLMFRENNVFPIMVDEIPANFFTGTGENLIVSCSNTIDESNEEYPAFIGTTNCSNYSMNERATRRSYYVKLDIPFIETKRQESLEYYTNIIDKLSTSLFQDFLVRFHEKALDNNIHFVKNDDNGLFDFLSVSREIFKDYYEEAGMPLPRYFGEGRLNDYRESGIEKWKDLFISESKNKNIFKYSKKEGVLYFQASELDKNQKMHQERRSQIYLKALPNHIFNGDDNAHNIKINSKEFFEWIGVKNPYDGWLSSIFS